MKDGHFYTRFTENLKLRFERHNKGLIESTKDRIPFKLIYYEARIDQNDAARREKYLKTFHGKMFLKRRLKSYLTGSTANESLSKKDFTMRIKICRKEAKESRYWLRLIDTYGEPELEEDRNSLVEEATELMNISGAILQKSK